MHIISEPSILYFGTPVILIGTTNENGTYNLAPMSSAFWLGWRCVIGLSASSQTTQNILRIGECVLNLASVNEAAAVNRLAERQARFRCRKASSKKDIIMSQTSLQHLGLHLCLLILCLRHW